MDPKGSPPSSQVALSWARSIQSTPNPISWRSISIVYPHPHVGLFLFDLPIKTTVWIIIIIFVIIIIIIQIHYMQRRRWHPHDHLTSVVMSFLSRDYNFYGFLTSSACTTCPLHLILPRLVTNSICWSAQIIKPLVMRFASSSCHFLRHSCKHSPPYCLTGARIV